MSAGDPRPLVAHVVHRFGVGGLENGVVNLVNRMPHDTVRHAIIAITEITPFRARIARPDVTFHALDKPAGQGVRVWPRLAALLRELRPSIVHTRNLSPLEMSAPAWMAGVPVRIHGEHGRDIDDLTGTSRRQLLWRRLYRPFVSRYVALSRDLERYLVETVGVPAPRVTQIYNGVDVERFRPAAARELPADCPFTAPGLWLAGTVGRHAAVKDPVTLVRAFAALRATHPDPARLRLVLVGDGPTHADVRAAVQAAGLGDVTWLAGERDDIPRILRSLDCFVLPSLAEGISNTILEAMASGVPVVATRVGGNAELVDEGRTGLLVPAAEPQAMAAALATLSGGDGAARTMGAAGRARVERDFSLDVMVGRYADLYAEELAARGLARGVPQAA